MEGVPTGKLQQSAECNIEKGLINMDTKTIDLGNDKISTIFWKYAIPSIGSMLIMAAYFVADGIIVARGVGSTALAAVNLSIPLMMGTNAVILALSLGASIIISIMLAQKKYREASNIFSVVFATTTIIAVLFSATGLFFLEDISYAIGATEEINGMVQTYLSVILYFIIFFCLQITLSNAIRNDGNPKLALLSTLGGSILNIPLDAFFVFVLHWGLFGAALATGMSQLVGAAVLFTHFLRKQGHLRFVLPHFNLQIISRIVHNAIPLFIETISIAIFFATMNILAAKYYGTTGVAAFAIVGAVSMISTMFFVGIGQTNQPLISYNFGHGKHSRIHDIVKYSLKTTTVLSIATIAIIAIFSEQLVSLYVNVSAESELVSLTSFALRLYSVGYIFTAINIALVKYFQSTEDRRTSLILTSLRAFVLLIPAALIVPKIFGDMGIWLVIPSVEFMIAILSGYIYWRSFSARDVMDHQTPHFDLDE
ncbi:MATE family efflux transporter [Methanolobus sp. ZRKC5]|uniref:MATE family efflux transporter n=1 Tax=Methanolobus sp. ZRKC5 TaxID=3136295 RepID=UPI00313D0EDC